MKTIHRIIVSAMIFSRDNKLLMCRKPSDSDGVYVGCWQIPGGGMNEDETKMQTLVREIKEEIGIDISKAETKAVNYRYSGESEKNLKETGERVIAKMDFNAYKVIISDKKCDEIKIRLNDEFSEYKWFETSDLKHLKLAPPSILLFKELGFL